MQESAGLAYWQDSLSQFSHPNLVSDWSYVTGIVTVVDDDVVKVTLPFAANVLLAEMSDWFRGQHPNTTFNIEVSPRKLAAHLPQSVNGVKNIIAVTSGKGGVGKSTTAVNLALALAKSGARTALLDADIYGPSVPLMLGCKDATLEVTEQKRMLPIMAHGIECHSIGFLMGKDDAAIWRGPMASKALNQLLNETQWHDVDYLVIDMPPGTGDIQLTLAQQIAVTGAVVVTTPQDLALADATKGIAMFEKVDVPVLGIVENMSYHICSECGHHEAIFGNGGAEKLAAQKGVALLTQIPLHITIREDIDLGMPTLARNEEREPFYSLYLNLAERIASQMYWQGRVVPDEIAIKMV